MTSEAREVFSAPGRYIYIIEKREREKHNNNTLSGL